LEALGRGERADIAFKTARPTRGQAPDLGTLNKGYRLARAVYHEKKRLGRLHQNKSGAPGAIDTIAKENQVSEQTVQDAWENFGKAIFQFGKELKEPLIIPSKKKRRRK
jgi:hypothetical protein